MLSVSGIFVSACGDQHMSQCLISKWPQALRVTRPLNDSALLPTLHTLLCQRATKQVLQSSLQNMPLTSKYLRQPLLFEISNVARDERHK